MVHCPLLSHHLVRVSVAQEVHAACEALPDCSAIEWSPLGRDGINAPVGTLKGTLGDRSATLDLRRVTWNPRWVGWG